MKSEEPKSVGDHMLQGLVGQGIVVVGGQWGDEGKGRIVDCLAEQCDVVVRFQGGNNAGHSLHVGTTSIVLHLIPCGIMHENKLCIIGNGVVIEPSVLFQEMSLLLEHGIVCTPDRLKIAKTAHIIFPFHQMCDDQRENRSASHIGTTKRGIGPCYEDKVARFGIMAKDLLSEDILRKKLANVFFHRLLVNENDRHFSSMLEDLVVKGRSFGERLAPFLCDTGEILHNAFKNNRRVLFEGAQGALLDVDHGTYPFVTSSNCVAAQASIGSGIGPRFLSDVLIVSKAYCTRVGEGPFFTEGSLVEQERFRKLGNEFGATTGRPRRCGWLDMPALKYAARINGATGLVLTKIDILQGFGTIKVGMSYSCGKKRGLSFLDAMELWSLDEKIDIEYLEMPSISSIPDVIKSSADLPQAIRNFIELLEKSLEIPVRIISYGRSRGQELYLG